MADRLFFQAKASDKSGFYEEELASFTYYSGFSITQKQKSICALHESILSKYPDLKVLEVSTKSDDPLGVKLSAFNLMYYDDYTEKSYHIENVFQAAKTYENGGPYTDLLTANPKEAKGDTRHHISGDLKCFMLNDWKCSLEPKTMFYDWIYCKALSQNRDIADELLARGYNAFTDIDFNHKRSINCQARAAAIFVSLSEKDLVEGYLNDKKLWKEIYLPANRCQQLTLDLF